MLPYSTDDFSPFGVIKWWARFFTSSPLALEFSCSGSAACYFTPSGTLNLIQEQKCVYEKEGLRLMLMYFVCPARLPSVGSFSARTTNSWVRGDNAEHARKKIKVCDWNTQNRCVFSACVLRQTHSYYGIAHGAGTSLRGGAGRTSEGCPALVWLSGGTHPVLSQLLGGSLVDKDVEAMRFLPSVL